MKYFTLVNVCGQFAIRYPRAGNRMYANRTCRRRTVHDINLWKKKRIRSRSTEQPEYDVFLIKISDGCCFSRRYLHSISTIPTGGGSGDIPGGRILENPGTTTTVRRPTDEMGTQTKRNDIFTYAKRCCYSLVQIQDYWFFFVCSRTKIIITVVFTFQRYIQPRVSIEYRAFSSSRHCAQTI